MVKGVGEGRRQVSWNKRAVRTTRHESMGTAEKGQTKPNETYEVTIVRLGIAHAQPPTNNISTVAPQETFLDRKTTRDCQESESESPAIEVTRFAKKKPPTKATTPALRCSPRRRYTQSQAQSLSLSSSREGDHRGLEQPRSIQPLQSTLSPPGDLGRYQSSSRIELRSSHNIWTESWSR